MVDAFAMVWNSLFAALSTAGFLVGTTANSFVLKFFLSRPRDIPNLLYSVITANDLVLSGLVLPIAIAHIQSTAGWFHFQPVCDIWGMAWEVSNQMSVYLVMLFNIVRTKKLLFPFQSRTREPVTALIVGYLTFLLLQTALPFFSGTNYEYDNHVKICRWNVEFQYGEQSKQYRFMFVVFYLLERLLPLLVVVVCCVVSRCVLAGRQLVKMEKKDGRGVVPRKTLWWEWLLCKKRAIKRDQGRLDITERLKHRASMTVLVTTLNFTVLNIPNVIYLSILTYDMINDPQRKQASSMQFDDKDYFKICACIYGVIIHAVDTPIVCMWRMKNLRAFLLDTLLGLKSAILRCSAFFLRKDLTTSGPTTILNPAFGGANTTVDPSHELQEQSIGDFRKTSAQESGD